VSRLEQALALARRGFYVFPVEPGKKTPAIKDWPAKATRDTDAINTWWQRQDFNIGVATGKFGDDAALLVVDVDTKNGKDGNASLLALELGGQELPLTLEQATPSGGRHLIYAHHVGVRQGVDVLGSGLDIRSAGGYILGPGSTIDDRAYAEAPGIAAPVPAPEWLVARLGRVRSRGSRDSVAVAGVDLDRAAARATDWLRNHAPVARDGDGGDIATFKVAAHLKDLGCTEAQAFELMATDWNERCEPPWDHEDLRDKVAHAYRYGKDAPGIAAPEAVFDAVAPAPDAEAPDLGTHPFDKLNQEFAFIKRGAFVLQETTDVDGRFCTEHLNMAEFHGWHANRPFQTGQGKPRPISEWWIEWTQRRQYEAVVFMPQQECGPRWYNLWRGFSVEPADKADHPALTQFLEHGLKNVCNGNTEHFTWLMGFFAHMVQRPWEKPLVALVFKGRKGTGKNALVERVGSLFGNHFMVADDERYLLSNFNSHLEANLFFVLDEAAWAGDKRAEGKLKGLTTGAHHNIERKGKEAYKVRNLTRIAIIGNEEWLVPASHDERRFAVFNVGDGRMQDRSFFESMRKNMEAGGYAHLLRYLLDFDLAQVDVNAAPVTQGLIDQKHESLEPMEQWWLDNLYAETISGSDWGNEWPTQVPTNRLRDALGRWAKARQIKSRLPNEKQFGWRLKKIAPSIHRDKGNKLRPDDKTYAYFIPSLEQLRQDWNTFIGATVDWNDT